MAGDIYVSFGAETGELESAMARTKAEVSSLARELRQTASEMQKSGADMDSALGESLKNLGARMAEAKTHMAELRAELRGAGEESEGGVRSLFEAFKSPLESLAMLRGSLSELAELAAAAFAVERLADFVNETAEAAERIERLSAMLGLTTTQAQKFLATAKLVGGDTDETARAMERLQLQLARTASASSPAAAALKALSINVAEFRGLDMEGQLEALAEAFSRFADGPNKTAAAMALLGRSGAQMIPMLDRGKEGLAELNKTAEETGVVMSEKDVHAMAELAESEKALGLATLALAQDIGINLAIAARDAIGWMTRLAESVDRVIKSMRTQIQASQELGAEAGAMIGRGVMPDIMAGVPDSWKAGRDLTVNAKKPQVPEMQIGRGGRGGDKEARDEAGAAREGIEEEIALTEQASQAKLKAYDDDLAHHRVTIQQWLSESQAALAKEAADVKAMYDKEAAVANQTATQVAAIKKREAVELMKINDQIVADQRKAADDLQKQWEQAANAILGPFNSALKGILTGHETMRQAAAKAFEGIAEAAVKAVEKMIVSWATGVSTKKALDGTAVTGDAGRAAAGAYAATAEIPIVGPLLAPAAAGAAFAATEAFASMDIGAYSIPHDQIALVHKNELVMPAAQAGAFRDMLDAGGRGARGGGDTHITNHIYEASNPHETARQLAKLLNMNPSLRPAY